MGRKRNTCVALAVLALGSAMPVQVAVADTPQAAPSVSQADPISSQRVAPAEVPYNRLLDLDAPLSERQAIFAALELKAQGGDRQSLYVAGSLYRIGNALPASPVAQDLAKARLYLSNAATQGEILAMAKMAELEAAAHHQLEAMTWAQVYGHYAKLQPEGYRPSDGYLAELVERASRGVEKSQLQDVVDDINAFITRYDSTVRAGSEKGRVGSLDLDPTNVPNPNFERRPVDTSLPPAGFADYYVSFTADGALKDVFLLDATPDDKLGKRLRSALQGYHIHPAPASQASPLRYVFIPVMFDDGRFRLKPKQAE